VDIASVICAVRRSCQRVNRLKCRLGTQPGVDPKSVTIAGPTINFRKTRVNLNLFINLILLVTPLSVGTRVFD